MGVGGACSHEAFEGCHGDVYALDEAERQRALDLIGAPAELAARAEIDALPLWMRWAEELVGIARGAESDAHLRQLLEQWRTENAEDQAIAASIYRTTLHAHMAGQLFVREVEVPELRPVELAARTVALDDSRPPFLRLAFQEAVEAFLRREIVTQEEWEELSRLARLRAFTATQLATDELVRRTYELLLKTLREGGTLAQFRAQMSAADLGIAPESPHYLETVYRTNVQMAYGQGRLQQLDDPDVIAARPYVQYRTAGDNRVRLSHAMLNGVVFNRAEDPDWRRFAPPLGFNCRCSLVTVREGRFDPDMVRHSSELANLGPDPGWTGPGESPAPAAHTT